MRITAVKPFPIRAHRTFLFVKVETDEGIYGIGESGLTWQERAVEGAVRQLEQFLIGQDPFRSEHLWQLMLRGNFFPADKVVCSAMSAIDIALWDIKGKALGRPVYDLLGGLVRDKVVCYPHNQDGDVETLVKSAKETTSQGWKFVRWGLPTTGPDVLEPTKAVNLAIQQFQAVRDAVGPDVELCFDVHTRLDPPHVVRLCREVEKYRPFFIEDPLRSENPGSYEDLARQVAVPIAAGEQWATKWPFREVIEKELIDYARIDLCIVGGITEAIKIAHWCETHYINLAPHNPLGPVSAAAGLHLCLACTNVGVLEMPRKPGTNLNDLFPVQVEWQDGYLLAPKRPGLGIEFDEAAVKNYPYRPDHAPVLHREDGAFTNW